MTCHYVYRQVFYFFGFFFSFQIDTLIDCENYVCMYVFIYVHSGAPYSITAQYCTNIFFFIVFIVRIKIPY